MMEHNDFLDEGMEERARNFEQMLNSGDAFFYDNDELGQIIDYYLDFEELTKAVKAIAYAESIYPFETYYKIKKAEVYIAQRNVNGAVKLLEKYRSIEPQNPEIATLLGDCYSLSLQFKRAMECYLFALNQEPTNEELLIRLARVNFAAGNSNKALTYINAIPSSYVYDELSIQEFVKLFMDYNQNEGAILFLDKVINEDPYNYPAWYFKGLVNQRMEAYENAQEAYEFCIAIDESNTLGHLGQGNSLMEQGHYEKAIASFKLSLDNDESDAEVLCNIAECFENLKDDNGAKFYYQKSIKINPHLSDAYFGMALIYKRKSMWRDAMRSIQKAIDIDQYESMYHIELAEIYLILEDDYNCYHHYAIAYDLDSDTTEILLDFAHAKFEFDDIDDAIELLLEHLEDHDEDHRMYYRVASYYFVAGHFEKGYNFLHAALKMKSEEYILLYEFAPFTENIDNISNIIDLYTK
jgi:tetratricopeptide (TPR) repeat protein